MRNLKLFAITLFMLMGTYNVFAQEVKEKRVHHLKSEKSMKGLNLSEAQKQEIAKIKSKRADEKKSNKEALRRIKKEEKEEIRAVLTPEQQSKMDELKSSKRKKSKKGKGRKKK